VDLAAIKQLPVADLVSLAESLAVPDAATQTPADLVVQVMRTLPHREGTVVIGSGTLEVVKEGYGMLRDSARSYVAAPDDLYVPPHLIKRLQLKTGDFVEGPLRPPKPWDKFVAIADATSVNGLPPEQVVERPAFDALHPIYPNRRIRLETPKAPDLSMRVMDLVSPLGFGQRGLIVAPPRAGKTILLQKMANAIRTNYPDAALILLLIDERPEEVTDFRATIQGATIVASNFDEPPTRHVHVAEMVSERARRLVECGQDVIILLDSITRLARAHNAVTRDSGRLMSGGFEAKAMEKPKRFFGSARNCEGGGSLTIIATALVETGSRMDEVIFEEFKGTGNMELVLDRKIAERRIWPAIHIGKSGTRREDLLFDQEEANRVFLLRHFLGGMDEFDAIDFLNRRVAATKGNKEFFKSMAEG
jgi:transcription termination factor Rho